MEKHNIGPNEFAYVMDISNGKIRLYRGNTTLKEEEFFMRHIKPSDYIIVKVVPVPVEEEFITAEEMII